jgi:hypothetical protein
VYEQFLKELSDEQREEVRKALSRQPYKMIFEPEKEPLMMIVGEIGDNIYTNNNESYRPFIADEFVNEPKEA